MLFPNRGPMATPSNLARVAEKAEALGYDTVWFSDLSSSQLKSSRSTHTIPAEMPFNPAEPYWEPLTVIGYVAGRMSRLRLGTSVLILPYRNPIVTAKMLATLDVLSNGRVTLGAGVGWMEEEFRAIGLDTYARRGAYSDECIRIYRELWTKDNPSFQGEFHQFFNSAVSRDRCSRAAFLSGSAGIPRKRFAGRPGWAMAGNPSSSARQQTCHQLKCETKSPNCGLSPRGGPRPPTHYTRHGLVDTVHRWRSSRSA